MAGVRSALSSVTLLPTLVVSITGALQGNDFVFQNRSTRLTLRPNATLASLRDKQKGAELLSPVGPPFAAVRKHGRWFPATSVARKGDLLRVIFGGSGIDADYRITTPAEYFVVELAGFRGQGIEEFRLLQLSPSPANAGAALALRWDRDYAVCLLGLSEMVDSVVAGDTLHASVFPAFPMRGERVALFAAPTGQFLETVRKAEHLFRLPSPRLDGEWAKSSRDVRSGYIFTDMTEANADETIRYAKQAGFRYIMIYSDVWSRSWGSYQLNTRNFPRGEASLKAVIDKCHAAGVKVGIHMLTSLIGKNDPLAGPVPSLWLLRDAEATLVSDLSASDTELSVTAAPSGFPQEGLSSIGPARDVQVDDEIIRYTRTLGTKFMQCSRGASGTRATPHKAGAKIWHLAEYDGSYIADLRTPLPDRIADRISGIINRCGFDMIYFDGGEVNDINGKGGYWLGTQQMRIWGKSKRPLLVQGSGMSAWNWHIFARGTSDDFSTVAVKEYLDYHKIADSWRSYTRDFLPAELGWTGFLRDAPDHPATTPDEVEYYAIRMMALDSPVSLETNLDALRANGRTGEMLKLLGDYEKLRLSGAVSVATRRLLETGEWHMPRPGEFHPIRYDARRDSVPGEFIFRNDFPAQPLKFRLQVASSLMLAENAANIQLLRPELSAEIYEPGAKDTLPGSIVRHFPLAKPVDLTTHRALAIRLDVSGAPPASGETAVLNVQLADSAGFFRDYYVDLDFSGPKTIVLPEASSKRMLPEFRPNGVNYPFKSALYGFNYASVTAVSLRWMRFPKNAAFRARISSVEALQELPVTLSDIRVSTGSLSIAVPVAMRTGDYAEYWGDGAIRVFDRNGKKLFTSAIAQNPQMGTGDNRVRVSSTGAGTVVLTSITLGN
jgi:hypothetical protein